MLSIPDFKELALAFDEAVEEPHFHKSSFRVRKKIFATLDTGANKAVLKFSEHEQSVFMDLAPDAIKPVKGSWGIKGWTQADLEKIDHALMKYALTTAYCLVAPKKLAAKYG